MLFKKNVPVIVKFIVTVNVLAFLISFLFWLIIYIKLFSGNSSLAGTDRMLASSTFGFMIADIIWALPLLAVSIYGLKNMTFYGWASAQGANVLWFYSMTSLWSRDIYGGMINPGNYIFLPFFIFSFFSAYYLWKNRGIFGVR